MFFEKAHEGRNAWWRWLLTILGTLAAWLAGHIPAVVFVAAEMRRLNLDDFFAAGFPEDVDRNLFLLVSLLPFVAGFLALWLLLRVLHGKTLRSVTTGRPRFAWGRAFIAFGVWFVICAAGVFAFLPAGSYSWQFEAARFWPLLAIALLVLPIQTSFEEVLFRGYLMQGVSLIARNRVVPLVVVTTVFIAMHVGNPEFGDDTVKGVLIYFGLSMLLGLAAVLDDGIEVPVGLHAANNMVMVLILSPVDGSFTTYSLFTTNVAALLATAPWADLGLAVLGFAVLAGIFGWRIARLFEPIQAPAEPLTAQT